jgi:hypothetical protein
MSIAKLSTAKKGWDSAIADTKATIERLKTALVVFEEKKAAGEPWPSAQADNQTPESCHSV